jgi:membrane protease YdiL (CAAX protease family)
MTAGDHSNSSLAPDWRAVGAFLALTLGLTWRLNLAIYRHGGLSSPGLVPVQQFQMLLPAFSAIVLGLLVFPESPIPLRRPAGPARWVSYCILLLTGIYARSALDAWLAPAGAPVPTVVALVPLALTVLGLLLLIRLRVALGREAMARVWLAWENWHDWLLFGLGFVGFYVVQVGFNAALGPGGSRLVPLPTPPGVSNPAVILLAGAVQSVLLAPFLAILLGFGEEYGWRGLLQTQLVRIGRIRGVLLVGVIWGAWHWPLILMGYDYPGHPALGVVLMTLDATGIAVVLGYAVLRSGSVLLAAYLPAVNDQVVNLLAAVGFRPPDPAFIGIYGIASLATVALLIFRDPMWRGRGSNLG